MCHVNIRMHPAASWNRPGSWALMSPELRAIKHTMELIAHSLCMDVVNLSLSLSLYRKRCTGEGGAGGPAWQNGPAQWAEYGNQV